MEDRLSQVEEEVGGGHTRVHDQDHPEDVAVMIDRDLTVVADPAATPETEEADQDHKCMKRKLFSKGVKSDMWNWHFLLFVI